MSIQDESFPYDDDIEFSINSSKNFVFPKRKLQRSNESQINGTFQQELLSKKDTYSFSSLPNPGYSTHSSNDFFLSSETCDKRNGSESNDLQASENKNSELVKHTGNKSLSYQDIHSEYTKRRYKHVESKVGRYIANMKAQDERRRNCGKFQRTTSMPGPLDERETSVNHFINNSNEQCLIRRSTNDLNNQQSDQETENYDNLTATTSSLSNRDSGSENGIYLDKQTYEQLLSDKDRKDYLQTKLEEKNAENCRLKQNLDTIRIEYSMCKDKLKRQTQTQRFSRAYSSIDAAIILGRTSSQCLLYPQETREKFTQTDTIIAPSPVPSENKSENDMFDTPDTNNNLFDNAAVGILAPAVQRVSKCMATIEPLSLNFSNLVEQDFNSSAGSTRMGFLRQRSNSLAARKKSTPIATNVSKTSSAVSNSLPSTSDSAIDIEVVESPKNSRNEIIYYEQHSQRYAVVETCNTDENYTDTDNNPSTNNNNTNESNESSNNIHNYRKRRNLRSRILRFFGACTKCEDASDTPIKTDNNFQNSQIPLLEKKYSEFLP